MTVQRAEWVPDNKATQCYSVTCERPFTMVLRRHHCRSCGNIFCSHCTSKYRQLAKLEPPERVCDVCAVQLDSAGRRKKNALKAAIAVALCASAAAVPPLAAGGDADGPQENANGKAHAGDDTHSDASDIAPLATPCAVCCGRPQVAVCSRCRQGVCTVCIQKCDREECSEQGLRFPVKVAVHEVRNVAAGALSKPTLCVLVATDHGTARTKYVASSYSPIFGEEFALTVPDISSSIYFRVLMDGVIASEVVGRATIALPLLDPTTMALENVWLELLPYETSMTKNYRSAYRPSPMRLPKQPLGWIRVSVSAKLPLFRHFLPRVPQATVSEFNSGEFGMHVNRITQAAQYSTPALMRVLGVTSLWTKAASVIPLWAGICCVLEPWHVPLFLAFLLVVNGYVGRVYPPDPLFVPVFEEQTCKDNTTVTKIKNAAQAAMDTPGILRKIQYHLQAAASFVERWHNMFSFIDPGASVSVGLVVAAVAILASIAVYLVPLRLLMFAIGCRLIAYDSQPKREGKGRRYRLMTKLTAFIDRVQESIANVYNHIPDALEVEHRYICNWQLCEDEPSINRTKRSFGGVTSISPAASPASE
ncbi:putative inactive serine/threonine-protein kinase slob1 [Diplonema papillatum]|nr:putative inactive serine/threonine-protein kinase slob1 [Diplonema papillatum]